MGEALLAVLREGERVDAASFCSRTQDGCRKKEEIKDWQGNVHFPRIVDPRSEIGGKMEDENDISFWNDGRTLFVQECILSTYPKLTRGAKFDKLFRTEQTR